MSTSSDKKEIDPRVFGCSDWYNSPRIFASYMGFRRDWEVCFKPYNSGNNLVKKYKISFKAVNFKAIES